MASEPNLEVNNTLISETTSFTPAGQTVRMTTISFMLGSQGPFRIAIPTPEFTVEKVKALVAEQQAKVRGVMTLGL